MIRAVGRNADLKKRWMVGLTVGLFGLALSGCAQSDQEAAAPPPEEPTMMESTPPGTPAENTATSALPADANKMCPVMQGQPVNPEFHTEYQGRTIYFCCASCPEKFKEDPEKYMANLEPAGGETAAEPTG